MTVAGLAVLLIGYIAASTLTAETSVLGYIVRLIPVGLGMGIFQSPNNSAIMGAVPKRALGVASGLLAVTRTLGQVTGVAVLGALWATRVLLYHGTPLPGGATTAPPLVQVAALQDTYRAAAAMVFIALVVGLVALRQERRANTKPTAA